MDTTIKLTKKTKGILDSFREYKAESYDEIVNKIVFMLKNPSEKNKVMETIKLKKRMMDQ
tara:strand:- start:14 stop:193 length:180 start_codon:yes stop_codon:yes gene_type:complete